MIYKISSGIFLVSTVVFAGLYLSEKEAKDPVMVKSFTAKESAKPEPVREVEINQKSTNDSATSEEPRKSRIVVRTVSSHPELTKDQIDHMLTIHEAFKRRYSDDVREEHPILFDRMGLDEETEKKLILLIGERNMARRLRPERGLTDLEKQAFDEKKQAILDGVDDKIQNLIGANYDFYMSYRKKSDQYSSVSSFNEKLSQSSSPLGINEQDQLADVLYEYRRESAEGYEQFQDWREIRSSPEKAIQMVEFHKARYDKMVEAARFLDDSQRLAFEDYLNRSLRRYTRWAKSITENQNKDN